jgi:Lar family restriction alleviation protein
MSELLSCPFCGGTPVYDHDDDGWNWIICLTCGVSTNAATHAGEDCRPMLAETWNRRATPAASPAVPQQPVATEWKMPQDQKLMQFINSTPLVMSLLYDINLLPEQIDNGRRWYYMVAVCEHMERALAALPASPAVPVQAAQAGWIPVSERMPPDDVPLLVYTPPLDGEEERIDFEWRDDGCWVEHNNCFDHYMAVTGGKGCLDDGTPCVGPAEGTPYTHWMLRPAAPSQPTEPGSQA